MSSLSGSCAVADHPRSAPTSPEQQDPKVRQRRRRQSQRHPSSSSSPSGGKRPPHRSSCASVASGEAGRRRAPTTSSMDSPSSGRSPSAAAAASPREKGRWFSWVWPSSSPLLPSSLTELNVRRSHLALDDRPLKDSLWERFRRHAETTNIHGFLPLARLKEMGCFFRVVFLFMLSCGISCATYFIRLETINFNKETVSITTDYEQATTADLYFPQVVLCNSNFIQATFLQEFNITQHANLLIRYFYSGSAKDITEKETKIIGEIEKMTLARRVAGALMRFGNSTSIKELLTQVENKTEEELLQLAEENGMPTPLPLVTGIKPGFRSILRATYASGDRDLNYMAPLFPSYRTDFGWCSLILPMVEFEHRFMHDNFQTLREKRVPFARRGARLGKEGGLRLLVDAEVYDYSYGSHAAEGFHVGVVPHRDIPLMFLDETQVRPGSLTNIIVKPVLTKTEPSVKARFDTETRQCYYQDEVVTDKAMGIGGRNRHRYSLSNCFWQATVSHSTQVCGCKMWNYGKATTNLNFCVGENLTCFRQAIREFSKYNTFTDNNNNTYTCYNDCESYTHSITTNSGSYPNSETFLYDFYDYCIIMDKMAMSCKDRFKREWLAKTTFDCNMLRDNKTKEDAETCTRLIYSSTSLDDLVVHKMTQNFRDNNRLRQAVWNYTSSNVALINVYFNEINVKRMVRKEGYTISSFMAAVGGLLSLAMGISFVTFFEMSYMLIRMMLILVTYAIAHCCNSKEEPRKSHEDRPIRKCVIQ